MVLRGQGGVGSFSCPATGSHTLALGIYPVSRQWCVSVQMCARELAHLSGGGHGLGEGRESLCTVSRWLCLKALCFHVLLYGIVAYTIQSIGPSLLKVKVRDLHYSWASQYICNSSVYCAPSLHKHNLSASSFFPPYQ